MLPIVKDQVQNNVVVGPLGREGFRSLGAVETI